MVLRYGQCPGRQAAQRHTKMSNHRIFEDVLLVSCRLDARRGFSLSRLGVGPLREFAVCLFFAQFCSIHVTRDRNKARARAKEREKEKETETETETETEKEEEEEEEEEEKEREGEKERRREGEREKREKREKERERERKREKERDYKAVLCVSWWFVVITRCCPSFAQFGCQPTTLCKCLVVTPSGALYKTDDCGRRIVYPDNVHQSVDRIVFRTIFRATVQTPNRFSKHSRKTTFLWPTGVHSNKSANQH